MRKSAVRRWKLISRNAEGLKGVLFSVLLLLTACEARPAAPRPSLESPSFTQSVTASPPAPSQTPFLTPSPSPTASPRPSASPAPTALPPLEICSPLPGFEHSALASPDILKNPFAPPPAGRDDGHFGIDLAYWSDTSGKSMLGLPIKAVLSGRAVSVIPDREPYGNMLIIETPLRDLPAALADQLPRPADVPQVPTGLNCPDFSAWNEPKELSVYILYAHMATPSPFKPGAEVACGEEIGAVGTTGRSGNYHLHLEMRVGPAGATFPHMAHYDNSASVEEIAGYCLWRVSGQFMPFDPLLVLLSEPGEVILP